jgi:hypothetical protein
MVFTDDSNSYRIPDNVSIVRMTFDEFTNNVQSKFDFQIDLSYPYKLCDFKPAYGYIFSEYIEGYEYWGYCDLDVVWGNLGKFIPEEPYDKISHAGHLSLYRCSEEIVLSFMDTSVSKVTYKDIFSNKAHFAFDEVGEYGINTILNRHGASIYDFEKNVAKITWRNSNLDVATEYDPKLNKSKSYDKQKRVFAFEEGAVTSYTIGDGSNNIIKNEWAYIHLMNRKMVNKIDRDSDIDKFLICAHSYEEYENINEALILKKQVPKFYPYWVSVKFKAGIKKIKRLYNIYIIKNR